MAAPWNLGLSTTNRHKGRAKKIIHLLQKEYPGAEVTVMGYSLGGTLAVHECLQLTLEGIKCQLITYGSPRVGNREFAEYVNEMIPDQWRVVYKRDIVVIHPFNKLGYLHSGTEIHFDSPSQYSILPLNSDRNHNINTSIQDHKSYSHINIWS